LFDFIEWPLYGMIVYMSWQQIYAWSKKIHRWAMWLAIALGIPLSITGVIMEEDSFLFWAVSNDWGYKIRELHRFCSNKFALVLAIMMVTGIVMWVIPKILSKRAQSKLS